MTVETLSPFLVGTPTPLLSAVLVPVVSPTALDGKVSQNPGAGRDSTQWNYPERHEDKGLEIFTLRYFITKRHR